MWVEHLRLGNGAGWFSAAAEMSTKLTTTASPRPEVVSDFNRASPDEVRQLEMRGSTSRAEPPRQDLTGLVTLDQLEWQRIPLVDDREQRRSAPEQDRDDVHDEFADQPSPQALASASADARHPTTPNPTSPTSAATYSHAPGDDHSTSSG